MFIMPKLKKLMTNDTYAFYPVFKFLLQGLPGSKCQFMIQKLMKETQRTSMMETVIL